jgi:cellulose synthase (UDP-forming)
MQIIRSRENPLWKRGLTLPQRLSYFTSMTTYFQALQLAVFVSMPALILATGQSPIGHVGLSFFARFVPYVASMLLAIKLTGGSRQRLGWDLYFSFLRMFIFLRALPTIVSGGRGLRFRVTPKASSGSTHRRGLYPHLAAALVNFAVIGALLVAPLPDHLGSATKTVAYVSAGIIAAVFTFALIRLWRRVYPRRDYRVALTLPTSIAVDGGPVTTGSTTDLSFGGAALTSPRALAPGTAISLRLLGEEPLTLPGTVVSCIETTGCLHRLGVSFGPAPLEAEKRLLQIILDAVTGTRQGDQREPAIDALPLATPVPRLALTGAEA